MSVRVQIVGTLFRFFNERLELFVVSGTLPRTHVALGASLAGAAEKLFGDLGFRDAYFEQLYSFSREDLGEKADDITIAYLAAASPEMQAKLPVGHRWTPIEHVELGAEERKVFELGLRRLRAKLRYQPLAFDLLPKKFTLRQLQTLYETVLRRPLDKRNFRKKFLGMEILKPLPEKQTQVRHRAAQLFEFDFPVFRKKLKEGFEYLI